jgi:hypothetical protein
MNFRHIMVLLKKDYNNWIFSSKLDKVTSKILLSTRNCYLYNIMPQNLIFLSFAGAPIH